MNKCLDYLFLTGLVILMFWDYTLCTRYIKCRRKVVKKRGKRGKKQEKRGPIKKKDYLYNFCHKFLVIAPIYETPPKRGNHKIYLPFRNVPAKAYIYLHISFFENRIKLFYLLRHLGEPSQKTYILSGPSKRPLAPPPMP